YVVRRPLPKAVLCHPSRRLSIAGSGVPLSACSSRALAITSLMASGTPQWSRIFSTLRSKRDTFLLIAKGWRAISRKRHQRVRARPVDPAIRCVQEQSRHRAPILNGTSSYVRRTLPDRNSRVLSSLREIRRPALLDNELPAPTRTA